MLCTAMTSSFKSCDGIHDIFYRVWFPEGNVRGVVQISHGMCEYIGRYSEFAQFFVQHGFVVCGNDHLGHGGSTANDEELGYFAAEKGWQKAVCDLHRLTKIMKKNYPDVPYFLVGHSMGSFIARAYCTKFGYELDGAVFCGTSGGMDGLSALIAFVEAQEKLFGGRYRSKFVNHLAFGAYNRKIHSPKTSYDWISRDTDIVDKYNADKKCTFTFTLNGFENLMKVLWFVSQDKWFSTFRKDLPVLLIAGDKDPVGSYGKGVVSVYNKMLDYHCTADCIIYPEARHELFNETNRGEVYLDVLDFLLGLSKE